MEQEHTVTEQEQGVEGVVEDVEGALRQVEELEEELEEIRARIAEADAAQPPERAREYVTAELELAARIVESRVEAARWWCTPPHRR